MADFACRPSDLTPNWLTESLRAAEVINDACVTGFSWQSIGTGQVGDSARIFLTYDREGAGPATIAGKFPAEDATSRTTAAAFGLYAKEVNFYREIQPHLEVRTPQTLVAELADDGVGFILLFEDLGPARGGNQLASCSAADARAGIRQAAALHASSWDNAVLLATEWLQPNAKKSAQIAAVYPKAQAIFRERYAGTLEPEFMAVCEALSEESHNWFGRPVQAHSIIHADFRLDNMLFDIKDGTEEIAVLDWQTVTIGNGLTDIAYFLGAGIGDAIRRKHETELIDLYCSEMSARGVPMTRDAIWDDYVIGALHGLTAAVFSAAYVERTPRGDENFLSMARGGCALALQHGSIAKLQG